jgi:hypothetical protein
MKSLERRIFEFLVFNNGVYVNPHRVVFTLLGDYSVHLSVKCPFRRFRRNIAVEYFYSCEDVAYFLIKFDIKVFADLGKIKPVVIQELYLQGQGRLFCLVKEGYLIFQLENGAMKVMDDDRDLVFEISGMLNSAGEFIDYTRRYYQEIYGRSGAY